MPEASLTEAAEAGTARDRLTAAASLLYEAFDLVPVFSMEAPAPEANEDGTMPEPVTKQFYSTDTTVATLDAVLMPAAPDAVDTWAETAANTVLEARLMDQIDGEFRGEQTMTRAEFALAAMKAVYGADKDMDFLAQGAEDGLLPAGLTLDNTVITRGEAAYVLDTAVKDLTIITTMSTSDIHGHMVPYTPSGSSIEVGGSAKAAWLFDEAERRNPNTLVLDGGDSPYNTDLANMSQGQSSVDVMNAQGYDATVLGNHDFDYAFDNLLSLAERAEYAMLSANTYWKDGTYPEQFEPYIVKEVGGLKVAIVGLTDDGSKATTHYSNTQDIEFHDHWEVGQQVVDQANAEADLVIMLAHLHGANNEVPTRIDGIDMEIGGGNDTFGRPLNIEGTVVVNPGGVGTCVNQTNLNVKDGELLGYTFNQIILSSDVPEDAEVKAIIDRAYERCRAILTQQREQLELTADYGQRVYTYGIDLSWQREGETVLTITAPENVAGITARILEGETALEYDGMRVETGPLDGSGMSPVDAVPVLLDYAEGGYIAACGMETVDEREVLRVDCREPEAAAGASRADTCWSNRSSWRRLASSWSFCWSSSPYFLPWAT